MKDIMFIEKGSIKKKDIIELEKCFVVIKCKKYSKSPCVISMKDRDIDSITDLNYCYIPPVNEKENINYEEKEENC